MIKWTQLKKKTVKVFKMKNNISVGDFQGGGDRCKSLKEYVFSNLYIWWTHSRVYLDLEHWGDSKCIYCLATLIGWWSYALIGQGSLYACFIVFHCYRAVSALSQWRWNVVMVVKFELMLLKFELVKCQTSIKVDLKIRNHRRVLTN